MDDVLRLGDLALPHYWRALSDDENVVDVTIILPTGRALESITPHLALSTDGMLLAEIGLAIDELIRKGSGRAARIRTILDIDFYEELASRGAMNSNALIVGSADVNLAAELLLDKSKSYESLKAGFTKPYEQPSILGVRGARYMFTVSPNTGLLAMYQNCWSSRPRVAILCAGLFAVGTIASLRLLLSYLKSEGDGNNRFNGELPLKIVDGVPRSYFHVGLKPVAECVPPMEVVNIYDVSIRE